MFHVEEFTKTQVLKLISNIEYDAGVKRRFEKEVKSKLWKTHKSFLSYPLLVTIMLLTYEQFADIPDKIHVFYGQAFDTLFQRHDAQKAQYVRKTHTGLAIDDFKSCLAAFCLVGYLEGRHSFPPDDVIKTAKQAIEYCQVSIDKSRFNISSKHFVRDLCEGV